jgi:hypothetical protein
MKTLEENFNFEVGNANYGFEFDHTFINNPIVSFCGRFPESPENYGFTVLDTGWDCIAHSQEFLLNGKKVLMLISDGNHLVNSKSIYAQVAIVDPELMENDFQDSIIDHWTISR